MRRRHGRPMNALVLVVAGLFVVAGVVLIVLSVVLFRTRTPKEETDGDRASDESPAFAPERAFIDEPLQSDFAPELGPAAPTVEQEEHEPNPAETGNEPEAAPGDVESPEEESDRLDDTVDPADATLETEESAPADIEAEEPAPADGEVEASGTAAHQLTFDEGLGLPPIPVVAAVDASTSQTAEPSDVRLVSYNFRVGVAADHLQHGNPREAIAEFEKALTLTDDDELQSHLRAEIGNAWRELDERESAADSYQAAADQTANRGLRDHRQRSADEMRAAVAGSTESGPADEEHEHR
jgi:hypothetical protein